MASRILGLCVLAAILPAAHGADEPQKVEEFKPYELVGEWTFINSTSGRKFSGDIKVVINSLASNGTMRGTLSYDGRQTNDVCTTRGVFNDEPVDAEIIKAGNEYKIAAMVKCARGQSPRMRSMGLVCVDGTCTQTDSNSFGTGTTILKEKRP